MVMDLYEEQQVRVISIDQLKERIKEGKPYVLADTRDLRSYNEGHIPGAISIPADEVGQLAGNYDKDMDIITYCSSYSCDASAIAAKEFMKRGFKNVWDYKGGLHEWVENGNPVESNL